MTGCPANGLYMEMQNIANRGSDTLELYGGLDRDPGICELNSISVDRSQVAVNLAH